MPPRLPHPFTAKRRARDLLCAGSAALVMGAVSLAGPAAAGDVEDLREENAELRRELEAAREEIRELRSRLGEAAPAASARGATATAGESTGAPAAAAAGATATTRTETELVPVRRVRVQVAGTPGADPARLSSEWMPVREGLRVLESVRLTLVREDERLAPRLALARSTPHGSLAEAAVATLEIDGRIVSCPRVDFTENRRQRRTPRGATTLEREQIATYAIPQDEFRRIGAAHDATFTAGPTSFSLTDEHLAAAAALAARQDRDAATP